LAIGRNSGPVVTSILVEVTQTVTIAPPGQSVENEQPTHTASITQETSRPPAVQSDEAIVVETTQTEPLEAQPGTKRLFGWTGNFGWVLGLAPGCADVDGKKVGYVGERGGGGAAGMPRGAVIGRCWAGLKPHSRADVRGARIGACPFVASLPVNPKSATFRPSALTVVWSSWPFEAMFRDLWNDLSAASVLGPHLPSIQPVLNPMLSRACWIWRTCLVLNRSGEIR
jgi:hypothetical protein